MGILNKLGGQLWLQAGSGAGVATLTAARTLTGESAHTQLLNPSGADRDVNLPNLGTTARGIGQWFILRNTGSTYNLIVKNSAGSTVATVTPGNYVHVVGARVSGTNAWYVASSLLSLISLVLTGSLTAVGITNTSTLDQDGNIDHDTTQAASGTGLDTLTQASLANGSPNALGVGITQITNNRSSGIATALDISVTGRAGDTGGTYEAIRGTPSTISASADAIFAKVAAGFKKLIDISSVATGEALVILAANLANAFELKEGTDSYLKAITTTASKSLAAGQRLTTTDGVASGDARVVGGNASTAVASVTVENTITETSIGSYSVPANTLKQGTTLRIKGSLRVTGNAAADTVTLRIKLGGTTLLTSAALVMIANDVAEYEALITGYDVPGAAANVAASARVTASQSGTFSNAAAVPAVSSYATNGALVATATAQWSAASASDVLVATQFSVDVVR